MCHRIATDSFTEVHSQLIEFIIIAGSWSVEPSLADISVSLSHLLLFFPVVFLLTGVRSRNLANTPDREVSGECSTPGRGRVKDFHSSFK